MRKSPVQVIFSTGDIKTFGFEKDAIECGLMTLSKEKDRTITKGHICQYSVNHLTMQERLVAVALEVWSPNLRTQSQ